MNELVKLAIDAHNGSVEKYSVRDAQETLRQALIEACGGDTKFDIRKMRDGKYSEAFALVEEILRNTIPQGFQQDALFDALVEYRNVAEGDEEIFKVEDSDLFYVDDISRGIQGIRRQRLAGPTEVTVPTKMHGIRIYEELSRVLAGRVDFNELIDKVGQSESQAILSSIYDLWASATSADLGGAVYYPTVGSYSESALIDTISHVEAAAGGKTATVVGTKKALRQLMNGITNPSDKVKDDMYDMGYIGKFYGSPVIMLPQHHKLHDANNAFVYDDNTLTIVAGDDKPIKFVYEGDPLMIYGSPENNADLTQEYFLADMWGMGIVMNGNTGIGKYKFA